MNQESLFRILETFTKQYNKILRFKTVKKRDSN